jgi:hypothetical protein
MPRSRSGRAGKRHQVSSERNTDANADCGQRLRSAASLSATNGLASPRLAASLARSVGRLGPPGCAVGRELHAERSVDAG